MKITTKGKVARWFEHWTDTKVGLYVLYAFCASIFVTTNSIFIICRIYPHIGLWTIPVCTCIGLFAIILIVVLCCLPYVLIEKWKREIENYNKQIQKEMEQLQKQTHNDRS